MCYRLTPMTGRCYQRSTNDGGTSGGRCSRCGVELATELLDLVTQLGRVLEPELLGCREHLLLELHDELLELLVAEPLDLRAAPAAARDSGLLECQELGDVGHALADRFRRDAVL